MNVLETLKELGGYWKWNGGRHLVRLPDGRVGDTFVDTSVLTCRPYYLEESVSELIRRAGWWYPDKSNTIQNGSIGYLWDKSCGAYKRKTNDNVPTHICGPALEGVTLAYEVARQFSGATAVFAEPIYETIISDNGKQFAIGHPPQQIVKTGQEFKCFKISEGANVLFVEDVITSSKNMCEMIQAIRPYLTRCNCNNDCDCPRTTILSYVLCLVNSSGSSKLVFPSRKNEEQMSWDIISGADVEMRTWDTVEEATEDLLKDEDNRKRMEEYRVGNEIRLEAVCPKGNWEKLIGEQ